MEAQDISQFQGKARKVVSRKLQEQQVLSGSAPVQVLIVSTMVTKQAQNALEKERTKTSFLHHSNLRPPAYPSSTRLRCREHVQPQQTADRNNHLEN